MKRIHVRRVESINRKNGKLCLVKKVLTKYEGWAGLLLWWSCQAHCLKTQSKSSQNEVYRSNAYPHLTCKFSDNFAWPKLMLDQWPCHFGLLSPYWIMAHSSSIYVGLKTCWQLHNGFHMDITKLLTECDPIAAI